MRYAVFSDIHSNLEALEAVFGAYKKESVDQYLCIGDLVGYAANPKECIEKVIAAAMVIMAGNHDWAAIDLFSSQYFNALAKEAISWTKQNLDDSFRCILQSFRLTYMNKDLTLVHGTLNLPEEFNYLEDEDAARQTFALLTTQVCFVGHTHLPCVYVKDRNERIHYSETNVINIEPDNKYIVNVGSVGQPRDNNPQAAYCIYDTAKKEILIKRADYDKEKARQKIINAGLPHFLGDRLLVGR